jgi:hypothetical protein
MSIHKRSGNHEAQSADLLRKWNIHAANELEVHNLVVCQLHPRRTQVSHNTTRCTRRIRLWQGAISTTTVARKANEGQSKLAGRDIDCFSRIRVATAATGGTKKNCSLGSLSAWGGSLSFPLSLRISWAFGSRLIFLAYRRNFCSVD